METSGKLYACIEDRPLEILVQGIAKALGLQCCLVSSSESSGVRLSDGRTIWVFKLSEADDAWLARIKYVSYDLHSPVIVVSDRLSAGLRAEIFRNGAITCLSSHEALQNLPVVVENVMRSLLKQNDLLPIAEGVTLYLPRMVLTDGKHQVLLPPIAARLLQCMASSPGLLVPHDKLMEAGWGSTNGVTKDTLHQHIHALRTQLASFGLGGIICSVRGSGYKLARPDRRLQPMGDQSGIGVSTPKGRTAPSSE